MKFLHLKIYLCSMENNRTTLVASRDGSNTLYSKQFGESYRSAGGAMDESLHTFVKGGLFRYCESAATEHIQPIHILEYGFGTGLNAYMTLQAAPDLQIRYTSVDLFPLTPDEYSAVMPADIKKPDAEIFNLLHSAKWTEYRTDINKSPDILNDSSANLYKNSDFNPITDRFCIRKILCDFRFFTPALFGSDEKWIDVIYFDPFSPASEPECWSESIFRKIFQSSKNGAILTTYSAKGDVKRALRSAGWDVSRVAGSGTKRHNVLAIKRPDDR